MPRAEEEADIYLEYTVARGSSRAPGNAFTAPFLQDGNGKMKRIRDCGRGVLSSFWGAGRLRMEHRRGLDGGIRF
jgi:hypothetical protein